MAGISCFQPGGLVGIRPYGTSPLAERCIQRANGDFLFTEESSDEVLRQEEISSPRRFTVSAFLALAVAISFFNVLRYSFLALCAPIRQGRIKGNFISSSYNALHSLRFVLVGSVLSIGALMNPSYTLSLLNKAEMERDFTRIK